MDLQGYASGHIKAFLLNYDILVRDLAEVAAAWPTLDEEERGYHRATLLPTWGNRQVLGHLFRAGRLTQAQQTCLAELDRRLLEQSSRMEQCYGLALPELLAIRISCGRGGALRASHRRGEAPSAGSTPVS